LVQNYKRNKRIWNLTTGKQKREDVYDSLLDAKQVWNKFINVYNRFHQTHRNLLLGADDAEKALLIEKTSTKIDPLDPDMTKNQPYLFDDQVVNQAYEQINEYKKNAMVKYKNMSDLERLEASRDLKLEHLQKTLDAILHNQLQAAAGTKALLDEQTETLIQALGKKPKQKVKDP
jgi:hypothetical protein